MSTVNPLKHEARVVEEEDDDIEDVGDEEKYLNNTVFQDVLLALYEVRMTAPLVVLLGIFLGYHLTISPYQNHVIGNGPTPDMDLSRIRPMLSTEEQMRIHRLTMESETVFTRPSPDGDSIAVRWFDSVGKEGNHNPPPFFYEGAIFGVSSGNPHELEFTRWLHGEKPDRTLYEELENMVPKPTTIMQRQVRHNATAWSEEGYAVYFSYADLAAQGKLSSDQKKPWKFVADDVMRVARLYRQVYITVWYANDFGGEGDALTSSDDEKYIKVGKHQTKLIQDYTSTLSGYGSSSSQRDVKNGRIRRSKDNPYLFKNIIQQVLPTRTGMNSIPSTVVVWLSAYNASAPVRKFGPLMPMDYDPTVEEEAMRLFNAALEVDTPGRGDGEL